MLHVLDSTVLIDYLRGQPAVERVSRLRSQGDAVATTAVNVEEIVRGLREGEETAAGWLFDGLVVLPVERETAWLAGHWRGEFARRGANLSQADCLVAAATARAGGVLATGNPRDFPMGELRVDHWPVGA